MDAVFKRKNTKYEPFSFSRRAAAVPLVKVCMKKICTFLDWLMLLYPRALSTDNFVPKSSDLLVRKRSVSHFTSAPLCFFLVSTGFF